MRDTIIPDAGTRRATTHAARASAAMEALEDGRDAAPPAETTEEELQRLARQAKSWYEARNWSQEKFCKMFSNLSGHRRVLQTLTAHPPSKWLGYDLPSWVSKYRLLTGALREYELREFDAELLTDLPHVVAFTDALRTMRASTGLRRALLIDGVGGSGKTSLITLMARALSADRVIRVRGRQSWASFGTALRHWLEALGQPVPETKRPPSAATLQERVAVALLKAGDVVVAVDELHRACPQMINALTDWITDAAEAGNRVHFVLAAEPSLWDTLTGHYRAEARQLTWNRLSDRLSLGPPDAAECLRLLGQRVDLSLIKDLPEAGKMLAGHAAHRGGRAFIEDVRRAAVQVGAALTARTLETIAKGVSNKNR